MNDSERAEAKRIAGIIEQLPGMVNTLSNRVGVPTFIDGGDDSRFLYDAPSWQIYQVLKGVRLVSALRCAMILLQYGHVIEAGVLLRTIDDFIAEIQFAQEAIANGTPTYRDLENLALTFKMWVPVGFQGDVLWRVGYDDGVSPPASEPQGRLSFSILRNGEGADNPESQI